MRLYFIALQFLTIIPLPFSVRCDERDLGRSMAVFPLVGLTLGGLLVGIDFVLGRIFPWEVTALLLVMLLAVVTGALHLDGLADVCDGLAARGGRERFLAVMKDSRVGAVGVVGLVLAILLKYEALVHLLPEMRREALFLFPMLARFSQVAIDGRFPPGATGWARFGIHRRSGPASVHGCRSDYAGGGTVSPGDERPVLLPGHLPVYLGNQGLGSQAARRHYRRCDRLCQRIERDRMSHDSAGADRQGERLAAPEARAWLWHVSIGKAYDCKNKNLSHSPRRSGRGGNTAL